MNVFNHQNNLETVQKQSSSKLSKAVKTVWSWDSGSVAWGFVDVQRIRHLVGKLLAHNIQKNEAQVAGIAGNRSWQWPESKMIWPLALFYFLFKLSRCSKSLIQTKHLLNAFPSNDCLCARLMRSISFVLPPCSSLTSADSTFYCSPTQPHWLLSSFCSLHL